MIVMEYINTRTTNEWVFIGNFVNEKTAYAEIERFCGEHNFKIYYYRNWVTEDGWTMIDFGSHIQFYRIKKVKEN